MSPPHEEPAPGRLYGVGVGPGDPDLITVKGARLIAAADVVAYHSGTAGRSIARSIVADLISEEAIEELLIYPVTVGDTDHPLGYYGAIDDFYAESAERLIKHLDAGRSVVVLAEGDPLFYSSYMYLHDRISDSYTCEVVPGVTSVSAVAAAVATPLARHEDVLTVLPGTLGVAELARRLADTDAAAIMKLGRTFPAVREALAQAGRLDEAVYVARASTGGETTQPVTEVDPLSVPYFSMILVPGRDRRADHAERSAAVEPRVGERSGGARAAGERAADARAAAERAAGERTTGDARPEVVVVGLGPGPDRWITPEVSAALATVDHVVGYAPYLTRVPQRVGLQRHPSGNTVEVDRARFALDLALAGERVAVVSGGDAGVFGMASAVFEAAAAARYASVQVTVLPGVTAAQAVAAKAGAPLGGDYAVVSLSDRLKPWAVIERRLRAVAEADLVLAIYNPASRSRTDQLRQAQRVLLEVRDPQTPVVVGRDVGRAEERLVTTTLGDLDPATVDMKCLLIVGSRGTRVRDDGAVWTERWVE